MVKRGGLYRLTADAQADKRISTDFCAAIRSNPIIRLESVVERAGGNHAVKEKRAPALAGFCAERANDGLSLYSLLPFGFLKGLDLCIERRNRFFAK